MKLIFTLLCGIFATTASSNYYNSHTYTTNTLFNLPQSSPPAPQDCSPTPISQDPNYDEYRCTLKTNGFEERICRKAATSPTFGVYKTCYCPSTTQTVSQTQTPTSSVSTSWQGSTTTLPTTPSMKSGPPVGTVLESFPSRITFKSSNVSSEPVNVTEWRTFRTITHPVQTRMEFINGGHTTPIFSPSVPSTVRPSFGFVQTIVEAYKNHHHLTLRPDDVWTAILVQFSLYVNGNAEHLRPLFVNHTGSRTLSVEMTHSSLNQLNWGDFVDAVLRRKMSHHLNHDMTGWAVPHFSTTRDTDTVTYGVILMASMQKYFDYEVQVACGIPKMTILGTSQDWVNLKLRVQALRRFNTPVLVKWGNLLDRIITEFIRVKQLGYSGGGMDTNFWGNICRIQNDTGGYKQDNSEGLLDGWITTFSAFDVDGGWMGDVQEGEEWPQIQMRNSAPGTVMVPLSIQTRYGTRNATMFAGHMGHSVISGDGFQPYSGWAVALQN